MTTKWRKLAAAAALGMGALASGSASAIVVGGVDFGALGSTQHFETTTLAETYINGNGQNLMGYGVINTVNLDNTYTASGQQLYFTFSGYTSANFVPPVGNTPGSVDFTGGIIQVFLGNTFDMYAQDSNANMGIIQGYTPWLTLAGHASNGIYTLRASGDLTGTTISFSGNGLLDTVGGLPDVMAYLNPNNIADGNGGFADIAFTTSGNNFVLNPLDDLTGCDTGQARPGQWCIAGSADLRGKTVLRVPEPASLALLGIALLGMGVTSRKRRSA